MPLARSERGREEEGTTPWFRTAALDGRTQGADSAVALRTSGAGELAEARAEAASAVEAGPGLSGSLLEKDLVNELVIYQAPHIMGSSTRRMFETPSWTALADRKRLEIRDVSQVGDDTRITATIKD